MAKYKNVIVIFGALILCLSSATPAHVAQPPTVPIFTLLDNNSNQVGTVILVNPADPVNFPLVTRVSIRDSTGVTRNIALLIFANPSAIYPDQGGGLWFESANCSGTPFIGLSGSFLTAFDAFNLSANTLTIATSNVPQTVTAHSIFSGAGCAPIVERILNAIPGEVVGNINDMFPPPYTLIAK